MAQSEVGKTARQTDTGTETDANKETGKNKAVTQD